MLTLRTSIVAYLLQQRRHPPLAARLDDISCSQQLGSASCLNFARLLWLEAPHTWWWRNERLRNCEIVLVRVMRNLLIVMRPNWHHRVHLHLHQSQASRHQRRQLLQT